jgi:hypothetical protein
MGKRGRGKGAKGENTGDQNGRGSGWVGFDLSGILNVRILHVEVFGL